VTVQSGVAETLSSPVVRTFLVLIGAALLFILGRELKKIPPKLMVLMAVAFMDMVGLLMIVPLMPFYVQKLGGQGVNVLGMHMGIGILSGLIASAFTLAQLVSSPMWGRFSDKFGRRPALLIALSAAGVAYLVFGFAESLWLLFLSRIVQGAGGGTVGVIQAYVADTTEPEHRARNLGWLSAATNLGVALGPVVGALAVVLGRRDLVPGSAELRMGEAAPGIVAALLCGITILFAWKYLKESRTHHHHESERRRPREALLRVITHSGEPSSRLIWIYAIAIGAFQGTFPVLPLFLNIKFAVTEETIGYFFMYIGSISVFARVLWLGPLVDRMGEARLSRFGLVLLALGLATMPLAPNLLFLALSVAMLPLGTAFTFPCVTALLSRVINPADRGLYMGLQQSFGGVSRIIAPLWAGFAFDALGHGIPFFTAAAFVLGTISLGLGLDQYAKRPAPTPPAPPPQAA
jgi:MFS family permease